MSKMSQGMENEVGADRHLNQKARLVAGMTAVAGSAVSVTSNGSTGSKMSALDSRPVRNGSQGPSNSTGAMIEYISEALHAAAMDQAFDLSDSELEKAGVNYYDEEDDLGQLRQYVESPKHIIVSWLDHFGKYGLGYVLSSGALGVFMKDGTTLITSSSRNNIDYISPATSSNRNLIPQTASLPLGERLRRDNFSSDPISSSETNDAPPYPTKLHEKMKIIKYFEREIMERLYANDSPLAWRDEETHTNLVFTQSWYRTPDCIMFRLSDGTNQVSREREGSKERVLVYLKRFEVLIPSFSPVNFLVSFPNLQFNFYDHVKLFISHEGLVISVIDNVEKTDGEQVLKSWPLDELISITKRDRSERERVEAELAEQENREPSIPTTRPQERKLARHVLKKLKIARDILLTVNSSNFRAKPGTQVAPARSNSMDTLGNSGMGMSKTASMASMASVSNATTVRHR